MDELISRQKVLEYLNNLIVNVGRCNGKGIFARMLSDYVEYVKNLPTIKPRVKGAWIEVYDSSIGGHNSYSCSNCGLTIATNPDYLKKHKFCFACGADMREEVNNESD